jgi:iron complex transport system substrate-binding protein
MKKTALSILMLLWVMMLAITGCAPAAEYVGDEPAAEPQRIISLMPSLTENLFALGLADSIVGVTDFCNYPPELSAAVTEGRIQKVGDAFNLNEELIVSLEPTLVLFGHENEASQALAERLKDLNIATAVVFPGSIRQTLGSIATLGELTGQEERAAQLIAEMETALAEIETLTGELDEAQKPQVLMLLDLDYLFVAGAGTLEDELITLAGGVNVAGVDGYSPISEEALISIAPDIILCSFPFRDRILAEKVSWQVIPAVQEDAVYDLDGDLINRPTPRLIAGLKQLLETLHPELE